ncbi:hypothetical protein N0V93_005492 [Gnomoniopsis smithogilvyi]|uniref:Heterokaryon incompatibility domain-containing protein n=1 Tax=Gnomoniopsis smithogilvyi TaxID=1191159 RepID=A0A9W8YWP6_9PEZI|nr:hypothetical protein N0V93_005492 [Gnomoniopsis smithogilvyi]
MNDRNDYWRTRLNRVAPYWPRRLLHIRGERLVSVERRGDSTYGDFESPKYNILSYTWGRFMSNSGAALPIEGVPWNIPRVRPSHFTTASFRNVIKQVALGASTSAADRCCHVWLDIACINQNSSDDEMMDEIGHQAAIFNRAQHCFIWLNHTPASSLKWAVDLWNSCFEQDFTDKIEGENGAEFIQGWPAKHRAFFSDPWFSSLWTLQEAFLRPDAILLTQEGSAVVGRWGYHGRGPVRLSRLASGCQKFCLVIETSYTEDPSTTSHGLEIFRLVLQIIDEYALRVIGESNAVKLYACSDNKRPLHPLDKIYGIQQVFGFSLGRASSLTELEDRFGASLNQLNPVIAQAFVHLEEPLTGRSWRITPKIHVPVSTLYVLRQEPESSCKIQYDEKLDSVMFRGATMRFEDCVSFWKRAAESEDSNGGLDWVHDIHLDRTDHNRSRLPASFFETEELRDNMYEEQIWRMNDVLLEVFGPELRVLRVGQSTNTHKKGLHSFHMSFGILVYPTVSETNRKSWNRIGFATWDVWDPEVAKEESQLFQPLVEPLCLA